jgi:hypothetical protein
MKNVTWRVDVGCSGPSKAGATGQCPGPHRSKGCGADHLAASSFGNECRCLPVELDAWRQARPVRGRLSRVIPSIRSAPCLNDVQPRLRSGRSNP